MQNSENGDNGRTFDRPIDKYPRVRDTLHFFFMSGPMLTLLGGWMVFRAWQGLDPGYSALMAFMMGFGAAAQWDLYHEDE